MKIDRHQANQLFSPVFLHWLESKGCDRVSYLETEEGNANLSAQDYQAGSFALPVVTPLKKVDHYIFTFPVPLPTDSLVVKTIQQYVAFNFPLMNTPEPLDFSVVSAKDAKKLLHDTRNRLNSLLLNAAVVCAKSREPWAKKSIEQIDGDGQACANYLGQFGGLL